MPPHNIEEPIGRITLLCRWICSGLLAAPLLYWWMRGYQADAYILLGMASLSLIAGVLLFLNSVLCFRLYRGQRHFLASILFVLVSVTGLLALFTALPGFRM